MITVENNKKAIDLINNSTPISNIFFQHMRASDERINYDEVYKHFVSWHGTENVNINSLKSKTDCFSKKIGSQALAVKILGSDSYKNHIWIVKVNSRPYIFFLSLRGLSVETRPNTSAYQVLQDLKEIKEKYNFNSDY